LVTEEEKETEHAAEKKTETDAHIEKSTAGQARF